MAGRFKYTFGVNEFKKKDQHLLKALLGEFIGVFLLNFFACGACTQAPNTTFGISLAFGLAIFIVIMVVGNVSGGHVNPAVTIAMLVSNNVSLVRTIFYIIVQCLGAIAGTASLRALLPEEYHNGLGHTSLAQNITPLQGLGFEFFLGFVLVLTVFGVCDKNKPDSRFLAPLAIGLSVTLGHLGTIKYTGASMNPARSLGTALITSDWDNHWIYWVGPILGGIGASLLYEHALKIQAIPGINNEYDTNVDVRELRELEKRKEYA